MSKYVTSALKWWDDRGSDEKRLALVSGSITAATVIGLYIWHESRKKGEIPCDDTLPFAVIEAIISKPLMRKSMNSQLRTLLDQYCTEKSGLYIEYNGFLSNHGAHAIVALYRLGCTKDTIVSYMKNVYVPRLQTQTEYKKDFQLRYGAKPSPLFQNVDISINKYVYFFKGRRENFYGLYDKFKQELETNPLYEKNAARLASKFFPLFSSGMSGAAFHGLIQLGYGLSASHNETILEGLSYLVHSYLQFDTQLQRSDDVFDDEEFTATADTNSKSKSNLSIVASIFDILGKMKREQHWPESPVSRLKQYANAPEITNIIGAGYYTRSMTILSNYAQAEITQRMLALLPLLTNLFATKNNVNSNNNESKNDENNESKTNESSQEHQIMQRIRRFVLSNVVAVWTYAKNEKYNDFYIFHGISGAWSLLEVIEKTKLYVSNTHACVACLRQFFYAFGAVYAMVGCPDVNCPQWLIDETNDQIDSVSRFSNVNDVVSKHSSNFYLSSALLSVPNDGSNDMKEEYELRDLLKRQIATMVNELKPIQSDESLLNDKNSPNKANNSFLEPTNENLFGNISNRGHGTSGKSNNNINAKPVWRDEHVYKGLQIILETLDDGLIDLRLARDAIAKLRYDFQFNAIIQPTHLKIASKVQKLFVS